MKDLTLFTDAELFQERTKLELEQRYHPSCSATMYEELLEEVEAEITRRDEEDQ